MRSQYERKFSILLYLALTLLVGRLVMVQPSPVYGAAGTFIGEGDIWTYFKGQVEPPTDWNILGFDDGGWLSGPTGIGYGDGDDATVLADMPGQYLSVYMRRIFTVTNPASLVQLTLRIDYDDGFAAYLNGIEVARRNLGNHGTTIPYDAEATASREAGVFETIDISDHLGDLITGTNILAIQVHNYGVWSSDLSMIPELHWVDDQGIIHLVRYPYLQMLGTDQVTIVWTTTEPGPSEVRYSTDLSYSNGVTATSTFKSVAAPDPYANYYEHVATLSNLIAGTTYNYVIYTQGVELATDDQLHFRTHPGIGPGVCTFNFAVFGDTSYDWRYSQDVRDQALARDFDFAINLGDLAYVGATYEELETNFFGLYRDILWNQMVWPTMGDHEYVTDLGAPYLDVFHLPEQAFRPGERERYYSFDYGNVHFVIIDNMIVSGEETPLSEISDQVQDDMADWLEADLSANDSFWTIVAMHHPWYNSDDRDRDYLCGIHDFLIPIFEAHDVDLVLNGHDHLYERTYPIKDCDLSDPDCDDFPVGHVPDVPGGWPPTNPTYAKIDGAGVIYVTSGEAGGIGTSYDFINPPPSWIAARSRHNYTNYNASYTHIYIDNGVMSLITIDDQGNVIDPVGGADPVVIIDRSGEPGGSCTASVSGAVYEDVDGNGAYSLDDIPLSNVQVALSNVWGTLITTTNVTGSYQFTGLALGDYTIAETDPAGYLSSGDVQGANDNMITVSLQSGVVVTAQNFFDFRLDFGDTPDGPYPTLLASDGARHTLVPGFFLGAGVDSGLNSQPSVAADGDDIFDGSDDEDGVTFNSPPVAGQPVSIDVTASAGGALNAWLDFNADGDWADSFEHIFADKPLLQGTNHLSFSVPLTATTGVTTYARFRFSAQGGLSYVGLAGGGEVEDCAVTVGLPPVGWEKWVAGERWVEPPVTITLETSDTVKVVDVVTYPLSFELSESGEPGHLALSSWTQEPAGVGVVVTDPVAGVLEWVVTQPPAGPITLTKFFQVEPCTWTRTILWEELQDPDTGALLLLPRLVPIEKRGSELWITGTHEPEVYAGQLVTFALTYSSSGGFENFAWIRSDFPAGMLFVSAVPSPAGQAGDGSWVRWDIPGGLVEGQTGRITITVRVSETLLPSTTLEIGAYIYNHADEEVGQAVIRFRVTNAYVSIQSGDWDDPATWGEAPPPTYTSDVTISAGVKITVAGQAACNSLFIAPGGELFVQDGVTLTVESELTNHGRLTMQRTNASPGYFHIYDSSKGVTYYGLAITPTGSLGLTEVTIRGNQTCGGVGNESTVLRCYEISPTSSVPATATFYYRSVESNTNSSPVAWHWSGSGWDQLSSTSGGSGDAMWVRATNVTQYSPFTLADDTPGKQPTAVMLRTLAARAEAPVALLVTLLTFSLAYVAIRWRGKM